MGKQYMLRIICIAVGLVSMALGTVGAFVPLLPTVPLYLLAALCFARGSRRIHAWFAATRLYKKHLEGYTRGQGMARDTKMKIMLIITLQMGVGFLFMKHTPAGRAALVLVWAGVMLYFIFGIRTRHP